jgi:hypothetical protein
MKGFKRYFYLSLAVLIMGGCALPLKYLVGLEKAVRIPQLVTHLEPVLRDNQIVISGKIILENPTESDLLLDKISLILKDGNGSAIYQSELNWEKPQIKSKGNMEAPVEIFLPLNILNQQVIQISIKTAVIYKVMSTRIPIESEIAVFHLTPLKDSLTGPLQVTISVKINTDILGNARVKYHFDVTNPFNVDLLFEDGAFQVYTDEKGELGKDLMPATILASKKATQIQGEFIIKSILRDIFIQEFIKGHAVKTSLSGRLRLPHTDIFIPFKAEAVQEIDFSLFSSPKK